MSRTKLPKLLCVDDHEGVIGGMRITLRKQFNVVSATCGEEALRRLAEEKGFAVVVTDMRMPGMDGVEVLRRARQISPMSRRILLTGFADSESAIAAVNEGAVFMYLTKPCSPPDLRAACEQALAEYTTDMQRLRREAGLVHEQVGVLADFLLLARPEATGLSVRMSRICQVMGSKLEEQELSTLVSAAKLYPLGRALKGSEELPDYYASGADSAGISGSVSHSLSAALSIIDQIPGASKIANLLRASAEGKRERPSEKDAEGDTSEATCIRILRAAALVAELEHSGGRPRELVRLALSLDPSLEDILTQEVLQSVPATLEGQNLTIPLKQLRAGMVVSNDLQTKSGQLLAAAGTVIRSQALARIQALAGPQLPTEIDIETTGSLHSPPSTKSNAA